MSRGGARPDVAVIITAHDAASSIADTLRSLAHQARTGWETCEIILVDDRSADGTGDRARSLAIPALRIVRIDRYAPDSQAPLTARQAALDAGVHASSAPVLLFTDADAVVPSNWVSGMLRALSSGADAIAGPIAFRTRDASRGQRLAALMTVDACYYLGVCRLLNAGGARSGMMLGNAAIRRSAYDRVGGFGRIGFALTEDLALARAVRASGGALAFPPRPIASVHGCATVTELVRRAVRTSAGPPSVLAAVLGAWALLLPALAGLALICGGRDCWLAFIARYGIGAGFVAYCTLRANGTRLWVFASIYELAALWIGVRVLVKRWRSDHVDWGGVRYARTASARGSGS